MVIPIGDDNPTRRTPIVTWLLIAINVVIFFTEPITVAPVAANESAAQACAQEAYFRRWAAIPKELTTGEQLPETAGPPTQDGCAAVRPDYDKSPAASVLFSMFLHGGLLHLLGNMLFLLVFGNNVEDRIGRLKFLLFYLACGFAAAYGFAFAYPDSTTPLIGASGAVAGVLGAYLAYYPRVRVTSVLPVLFFFPFRLPAWVVLGSWFLLQWVYAQGAALVEGGGVAYQAHVVGFVAGFLVALVYRPPARGRPRRVPIRFR